MSPGPHPRSGAFGAARRCRPQNGPGPGRGRSRHLGRRAGTGRTAGTQSRATCSLGW